MLVLHFQSAIAIMLYRIRSISGGEHKKTCWHTSEQQRRVFSLNKAAVVFAEQVAMMRKKEENVEPQSI
jgi:hypothetical protein